MSLFQKLFHLAPAAISGYQAGQQQGEQDRYQRGLKERDFAQQAKSRALQDALTESQIRSSDAQMNRKDTGTWTIDDRVAGANGEPVMFNPVTGETKPLEGYKRPPAAPQKIDDNSPEGLAAAYTRHQQQLELDKKYGAGAFKPKAPAADPESRKIALLDAAVATNRGQVESAIHTIENAPSQPWWPMVATQLSHNNWVKGLGGAMSPEAASYVAALRTLGVLRASQLGSRAIGMVDAETQNIYRDPGILAGTIQDTKDALARSVAAGAIPGAGAGPTPPQHPENIYRKKKKP